jgi:hypothetical protein
MSEKDEEMALGEGLLGSKDTGGGAGPMGMLGVTGGAVKEEEEGKSEGRLAGIRLGREFELPFSLALTLANFSIDGVFWSGCCRTAFEFESAASFRSFSETGLKLESGFSLSGTWRAESVGVAGGLEATGTLKSWEWMNCKK